MLFKDPCKDNNLNTIKNNKIDLAGKIIMDSLINQINYKLQYNKSKGISISNIRIKKMIAYFLKQFKIKQ